MSDENRTPETEPIPAQPEEAAGEDTGTVAGEAAEAAAEEAAPAAAVPAPGEDKALNDELEQLRDTFQSEYDKTRAEAKTAEEALPEIQALEDAPEEEDEPEDPEAGSAEQEDAASGKKKEKKKMSGKMKALIAVLVCVCVLIVAPLLTYFVVSLKVPNFNSFISAYAKGAFSRDAAERVSYLTEALGYVGEDENLTDVRQTLQEDIAVATCEKDGYAAAMSYANANLTEEQRANPKTGEFRKLLEIGGVVEELTEKLWDAAAEALGDGTDAEAPDYEAAAAKLGAPDLIKGEVAKAIKDLATGMAQEKTAETKEEFETAITSYLAGYNDLTALGAKGQTLLETVAIKLFDAGYAYEAQLTLTQHFDEEMLESSENADFNAMREELAAMIGLNVDPAAIAAAQAEKADLSEEAFLAALPAEADGLSDRAKKGLALIAKTVGDGMNYEGANNLTKAQLHYATALSAEETLELPTLETAKRAFSVAFRMGDLSSAHEILTGYIDEAAQAAADEAFRADVAAATALYDAQYAANEAFYPFYYNAMYSGAEMNKDEINTALDALVTAESSAAQKGYVAFYKYLAEAFTDRDYTVMAKYLDEFAGSVQAYPMLYGYSRVQLYMAQGMYDEAAALVRDLLQINTADDLGNSVLAMNARRNGSVEESLELAEAGMELSGAEENCAHQAVIDYLLLGRYDEAYTLAYRMFKANLTTDNCEMLKILAAVYDGDDKDLKQKLEDASAEVDGVYAQYGVTVSENAQAILDGTKTPADVFTAGTFDLA